MLVSSNPFPNHTWTSKSFLQSDMLKLAHKFALKYNEPPCIATIFISVGNISKWCIVIQGISEKSGAFSHQQLMTHTLLLKLKLCFHNHNSNSELKNKLLFSESDERNRKKSMENSLSRFTQSYIGNQIIPRWRI